jgi:hypothetical protein
MATLRIPIDLRNPRVATLAGNAFFNVIGLSNIDQGIWEFLKDVDGKVYGVVTVPSGLAGAVNPAIILVIGANATTGVTRMNVSSKSIAPNAESYNVTLTADTAQDVTVPATARLTKEVTFTVGDLANLAENDLLIVEIFHEGVHANDTLAVSTELLEAYLRVDLA